MDWLILKLDQSGTYCVTTRLAKARIHLLRVHTIDKAKYTEILSQNKILIIY